MGKLIYLITTSLDGFVADEHGSFDWTTPSEEVLAFVNNILKNVGTFLFGRRMHETMAVWDTMSADGPSDGMNQFTKIWNGANKIVYSTSLAEVATTNTVVEPVFDPAAIRRLMATSNKDFDIGGPQLAAEAIKAGLVDEFHQFIAPKIIRGSKRWLPEKFETELKLVDMQKFENGCVHLEYIKFQQP